MRIFGNARLSFEQINTVLEYFPLCVLLKDCDRHCLFSFKQKYLDGEREINEHSMSAQLAIQICRSYFNLIQHYKNAHAKIDHMMLFTGIK